ncbi:unnamed protein product [Cuscuta campestris]|uniref:Uncharacterized protein n=1 Tax=Cuscuta campestris TaxID=132261 RepID=A0A484NEQ9_9ASTE|nr:unnamed protein product [Cuscuta campestris]
MSIEVTSEAHSLSSRPICHCGHAATIRVSGQANSFGDKFYGCPKLQTLPTGGSLIVRSLNGYTRNVNRLPL